MEEYKLRKTAEGTWVASRTIISQGVVKDCKEVTITDSNFLLCNLPYIFEGCGELARLREAGL